MRFLKKRLNPAIRVGEEAQSSLELAASLIVVFILLFGSLQVFIWANKRLVQRQKDYEAQRLTAGNSGAEVKVDESDQTKYPKLDIFGKNR